MPRSKDSNLFDALAHRSDLRAKPALIQDETVVTYEELVSRVRAVAKRLRDLGLADGDRVLILIPNTIEHVVALLAVMSAGGVAVPLDVQTGKARLAHVIKETTPGICLLHSGIERPATFRGISHTLSSLLADTTVRSGPGGSEGKEDTATQALEEDAALIRYSSGTTGVPKGVPLTHRQILWTAQTLSKVYGLEDDHKDYVVSPMAHSGSWQRVALTLVTGGCVVIGQAPVSISVILEEIEACGATGFYMPPPMLRMLLKAPPEMVHRSLRNCRTIESGSAPLGPQELYEFLGHVPDARVFFHYGLTECSRAAILAAHAHPDKLDTVGRPTPGVDLRIVPDDGQPAEVGQSGQILLRGPQLSHGYWNRPELTAERYAEGWFSTGDYGALDGDGFVKYLGRKDDLIVSAAYSFFPAEIEAELGSVEGIAHYLVAGVPDPRGVLGDLPWAFVVPEDPNNWSPRDFLAHARKRLPPHMMPRTVIAVPSLPLTPSGKPDRRSAVALYGSQDGQSA